MFSVQFFLSEIFREFTDIAFIILLNLFHKTQNVLAESQLISFKRLFSINYLSFCFCNTQNLFSVFFFNTSY